jgi:hypothetical protein
MNDIKVGDVVGVSAKALEILSEACIVVGASELVGTVGNVTLVHTDEDNKTYIQIDTDPTQYYIPAEAVKPIVHYDIDQPSYIVEGQRAVVTALDHPSPFITENVEVTTSTVLTVGHNGFETLNTIYMPNKIVIFSPYLKA